MRLGDAAELVTRSDGGQKRLSLAQPARVLRVQADPPGDARGEEGDAGQPGEQAQGETSDVEEVNPRLQCGDLVVLDSHHGRGAVSETGDLAAQQVHRVFLVLQPKLEAPEGDTAPNGRTQLRELEEHLARGRVRRLLLADVAFSDGRFPQ